jgi:hypothetical protein
VDIERIPQSSFPKKLLPVFSRLDKMAGLVKEASVPINDYLSIAGVANEYAIQYGARRDGKLVYRGMLLKKHEQ